jgi:hypothetical protein
MQIDKDRSGERDRQFQSDTGKNKAACDDADETEQA